MDEHIDPIVHFLSFLCIFLGIMLVNYKGNRQKAPSEQIEFGSPSYKAEQMD